MHPGTGFEWVECPRDAMQGIVQFIPTQQKINYLNSLLKVGFNVLDFGSFVSEKAIPQLKDTAEVLENLDDSVDTRLLAIVANCRGAETACTFPRISCIGYPLSVSETFQQRNTNSGIEASFQTVVEMAELADAHGKELVIYLSMAFGNPYGEDWSPGKVEDMAARLVGCGITTIALADTVGVASPESVQNLFGTLIPAMPEIKIGAHLHARHDNWKEKVDAAWNAGCRRFDSAMKGYGGCPMAKDELVGNLASEHLLDFLLEKKQNLGVDLQAFQSALKQADFVFSSPTAI
ncbi:MAG: hydroxymethylglutaryl-CoA lyase [Sphingobacteriales bacterium]|nr:hydroxymethylglutaryl-CoA lyase [Sphingobacteriales bacterium]